jgi:hypothetical protein
MYVLNRKHKRELSCEMGFCDWSFRRIYYRYHKNRVTACFAGCEHTSLRCTFSGREFAEPARLFMLSRRAPSPAVYKRSGL